MSTTANPAKARNRPRLAGTVIERWGWLLDALLCVALILMGVGDLVGSADSASTPIDGSGCCNGHRFDQAPQWTFQYLQETFHYEWSFGLGMGIFGLALIVFGLRRGQRWAWFTCLYLPVMFAIHSFALGSGIVDVITMSITILGLALMIRPVFAGPPEVIHSVSAQHTAVDA